MGNDCAIMRQGRLFGSRVFPILLDSRNLSHTFGCGPMSFSCEICGKSPQKGNSVTTRGKAKYLGGVGTKVTGISLRTFKPNLQRVRITTSNGTNKRVRVCTQCLRSGAVTRAVRNRPFRLPTDSESKGKAAAKK